MLFLTHNLLPNLDVFDLEGDDRESNIDQWRAAGGIGILHTSASDTIRQLKKLGL